MTIYYPPKYATYSQLELHCKVQGVYPHDELQRYARAYGEHSATQLWYSMIVARILENACDTQGKEQEAWKDLLLILQRHADATLGSKLYWVQQHASYAYKRTRSPGKRHVYGWAIALCKPIQVLNVGLCVHCGYDRVYGTGLCVNCSETFSLQA